MKLKLVLIVSSLFLGANCFSQNKTSIHFYPKFGDDDLKTDTYYKINNTDSLQITALKFYISVVEIWQSEKLVWKEKNSFHLVDISKNSSLKIALTIPSEINFTELKFNLGIDSLTNVSGALGGDLDPTKGMYWTWQSGYINFKLEGNSNLCKTRNNEFQFHLGGYQHPFYAMQQVVLKTSNKDETKINIDVQKIINSINLKEQNHIMSPSKEAVSFSEKIAKLISAQ